MLLSRQANALAYSFLMLLLAAGCSSSEALDPTADTTEDVGDTADTPNPGETEATTDRTPEVYDPSRLLRVEIELPEADWTALRGQNRTPENLGFSADCMPPTQPFESPFEWFSATVSVDGERFENVGVRKKGFIGSMSYDKPSFKVRFDKFEEDQTFLDAKRLTLNNDVQDPSYVRQCLAYDLFRAVGVAAPRCNYAHVFVNGNDLGVYTNVESIKKPFIRRNFADPEGNLFEGTLSDFREGWMGTFNQKTNESTPDKSIINAIADVLQGPDDQLIEGLSQYIDMDDFLNFWAVETLTAHWDGYAGNTNNYHFYHDPTSGKLHFIPWGVDQTFGITLMLFEGTLAPRSINTAGLITRRLYLHPEGQSMYIDRLVSIMDAYWDVEAMTASVRSMHDVFKDALLPPLDPEAQSVDDAIDATLAFLRDHPEGIRAELSNGPVSWDYPLRQSLCDGERGRAEWNASISVAEGAGEVEYTRPGEEEDGDCRIEMQLTGIASIDLCGEGCSFAMEMRIINRVVIDEANSGCTEEERASDDSVLMFGQSTIQVGEYEDSPVWALMGFDEASGNWGPVPNGYSLSFGGGEDLVWFFGASF